MKATIKITALLFCLLISRSYFSQGILNSGFEVGNPFTAEDWYWSEGNERDSTYVRSGNYSMAVHVWYYYAPGLAVNGSVGNTPTNRPLNIMEDAGTPFTQKPTSIDGYYLYENTTSVSTNDSASIEIVLKKTTPTGKDTIGYGKIKLAHTGLSVSFVPFQVPITYFQQNVSPDSIIVILTSDGQCNGTTVANCNYLYVDDLSATLPTGQNIPVVNDEVSIWPNPFSEHISVLLNKEEEFDLRIIDLSGKEVFNDHFSNYKKIDLSHLSQGIYTLVINSNEFNESYKVVKK